MNEQYINEVKSVIHKFLDGYKKRDLNGVEPTFPTKPTLRHKMDKHIIVHLLQNNNLLCIMTD